MGDAHCPTYGQARTVIHAPAQWPVARAFWCVATRLYAVTALGLYHSRGTVPRSALGHLVPVLDELVL